MFGIGPVEFGVVLVLALLIMGPKKLPELARTLGRGMAEFRRASNELRRSIDMDLPDHKIEPPAGAAQAGLEQGEHGEKKGKKKKPKKKDDESVPATPPPNPQAVGIDTEGHGDASDESVPVDTGPPPSREPALEADEDPARKSEPTGE